MGSSDFLVALLFVQLTTFGECRPDWDQFIDESKVVGRADLLPSYDDVGYACKNRTGDQRTLSDYVCNGYEDCDYPGRFDEDPRLCAPDLRKTILLWGNTTTRNTSIDLTWIAPSEYQGELKLKGYFLTVSSNNQTLKQFLDSSLSEHTVSNLQDYTYYRIKMRPVFINDGLSPPSYQIGVMSMLYLRTWPSVIPPDWDNFITESKSGLIVNLLPHYDHCHYTCKNQPTMTYSSSNVCDGTPDCESEGSFDESPLLCAPGLEKKINYESLDWTNSSIHFSWTAPAPELDYQREDESTGRLLLAGYFLTVQDHPYLHKDVLNSTLLNYTLSTLYPDSTFHVGLRPLYADSAVQPTAYRIGRNSGLSIVTPKKCVGAGVPKIWKA